MKHCPFHTECEQGEGCELALTPEVEKKGRNYFIEYFAKHPECFRPYCEAIAGACKVIPQQHVLTDI